MRYQIQLHLAILRAVRTQTKLSAVAGISETRVSRIVNGWSEPTADECRRIADAVGMPVDDLFSPDEFSGRREQAEVA